MADATGGPSQIISLPEGGGGLRGLGETFMPDAQTGTGNMTVPIAVPPGRRGLEPKLELAYSTGNGNGAYGLGWSLTVPGITRKTSRGIPTYDDGDDTFILSGAEDLVPLGPPTGTTTEYRPRTEGLFARVVHHRDRAGRQDTWEVTSKDGLVSRYGTKRPAGTGPDWYDPAAIVDPASPGHVFAWKLTETRDPLGNTVVYEYDTDAGQLGNHHWRQPLLRTIRYADYTTADGTLAYLCSVAFTDEARDDAFSSYTAGFEIRTARRYRAITTTVHTGADQPVRRYELRYQPDPYNGVSLLTAVEVVGFDDVGDEHRDLPPVEFGYGRFEPADRRFQAVGGAELPSAALSRGDHELVDLTGDGLPDVLQLNGVARYWRNLGAGVFDRPRPMRDSPAGLSLTDHGVRLLDADGDGRADLLVTVAAMAGYFPLRFGATWGSFHKYTTAPSFSLDDPQVRLIDLDGDGVTDALSAGSRLECFFSDPDAGWTGPVPARGPAVDGPPLLNFTDPRVRWADMTGDGMSDLVLVHDGSVEYWPNLGHGSWGGRIRMVASPRLPFGYDPERLLLADVDGDGLADLIYVGTEEVAVWFNRSGNGWSEPVEVRGVPVDGWDVRVTDLLGTGTGGVLCSRDATTSGRPSMYFLDLTGGVKPRLLNEVDNGIGAVTRVGYAPSTIYSTADNIRPATRWRTPLPFVVPVVARVETIDGVSGGRLTTTYRYRHGYWDGAEREFRGFGCVEQTDTEPFDGYDGDGLHPGTPFARVTTQFSTPTLTRTWFHLGPVDTDDEWVELDLGTEYWSGDPHLIEHTAGVNLFLSRLPDPTDDAGRRVRRDALRALRGRVLRRELYGLDTDAARDRPYTVIEYAYGLREEPSGGLPARPRVFFAFETAQRTTRWERGDDPMTTFEFIGDYDAVGQPRRRTTVAPPRRSANRRPVTVAIGRTFVPDEQTVLARHTRTAYVVPAVDVDIHNRVAQTHTYELAAAPTPDERDPADVRQLLADQWYAAQAVRAAFDALTPDDVRLVGHVVHHYDGAAFTGLPAGQLGAHGLLTRTETLVFTDAVLADAYGDWRPDYLGGAEPLPSGAPAGFGADLGYRVEAAGPVYAAGWYADSTRQAYDVQVSTTAQPLPRRGLVLGVQDPLGHTTQVTPDRHWLLPAVVRDPAGLETTVSYDYRAGRPRRIVDPNGHATNYRYHPLGLLTAVFLEGRDHEGGSAEQPEIRYTYDLGARATADQPVHVHTARRLWHASDAVADDVVESREYSDGFGRLVQKRVQADDLAFGPGGDDTGLLVPDGTPTGLAVPGQTAGPAAGGRVADRVVVSGWQVHDNKGRVVGSYEPFFDRGWAYQPEEQARRGRRVTMFYDPRGQLIRVVNPDGSQRRTVFGEPPDPADPDGVDPTPWAATAYDENDLAPLSSGTDGGSLASRAPAGHHFTPTTIVVDALGRTVCQVTRGGPQPATDWHATRTTYDIRGNVLTVVDELGRNAFAHGYDLTDRQLRADSLGAGRRVCIPDAAGNPVHTRDARTSVTLRTYDVLSRPAGVLGLDSPGARLTLRERLVYGDGGDPDQPADERIAARTANRLGRLWRQWDEAGQVTIGSYDFTGGVTTRSRRVVSDAAIAAAEPAGWTADWAAPAADSALDAAGYETSSRYDALARVVEIVAPADVTGRRARISPSYGPSGALRSVDVDGTPYVRQLVHNARGQRLLVAYGNGTTAGGPGPVTRYAYDGDTFRLVRLRTERASNADDTWIGAGPPLQDLTYNYDLVGNVTAVEERTPGCGVAGTATGRDALVRTFDYDAFYRLVSATGRVCDGSGQPRPFTDGPRCGFGAAPFTPPAAPTQANAPDVTATYVETYRYDPTGNLFDLFHRPTSGPAPTGWHRLFGHGGLAAAEWADAPNNLLTRIDNGAQPTLIGYDAAGNMATDSDSRSYRWDHAGRLVGFRVQAGAGTSVSARYLYGADGVRTKKWVRRNDGASLDESTVYVGDLVEHHRWAKAGSGENSVLHVLDGTGRIALVRTGPAYPGDAGPATRYDIADHLGSVCLCLDATGGWTSREEYFPYGESSFGSFASKRYRFAGKERDDESGLCYYGVRYYAPWLARFVSGDPLGACGGANPYTYCRDNPVSCVDAVGLASADAGTATDFDIGVSGGTPAVAASDGGRPRPSEGGGFTYFQGELPAPDAGTPGHPSGSVELFDPSVDFEATGTLSIGTSTTRDVASTASKPSARSSAASLGLSWSLVNVSGALDETANGSYNSWSQVGTWSKETWFSYEASVLTVGLSTKGPELTVVKLGGTAYSEEYGAIAGDWTMGVTGQFSVKAGTVDADIGLEDATLGVGVGCSIGSARLSGGFNVAGANLGLFLEARAGGKLGFSGGKETAVHAGLLSGGLTVGAAKGNDPHAGWANLAEDTWTYLLEPVLDPKGSADYGANRVANAISGALR